MKYSFTFIFKKYPYETTETQPPIRIELIKGTNHMERPKPVSKDGVPHGFRL